MGTTLPSSKGGWSPPPQFSAHVYCGQTAGWMKLVLGMEVGLSPGDFVLDGDPTRAQQQLRWATMVTVDMGRKEGGCCAPFAGAGTPSSIMWPGPRSTSVPSGVFIQPFGHSRHGPKIGWGGCAFFSAGVAGSTSNTMWRRLRPTSVPSGILMHPAVWPQ